MYIKTQFLIFGLAAFLTLIPSFSKEEQKEHALISELKNGLKVIIVNDPVAPVVTTVVTYKAGSNECPEGFPGTAHAQEHMMFRGTKELSGDQLANLISLLGGKFNAVTSQTLTSYFMTMPSNDLKVALKIEASRMKDVLDSESLWEMERGAIKQEVAQDLSSPEYLFYTKILSALFKGTPYAHDALGTVESFDKTTGAMLKKFHDDWYAPNNAILIISGKVNANEALKTVKECFDAIPPKKLPEKVPSALKPVKPERIEMTSDLSYGIAGIAFRLPGTDDKDYAAAEVLADILDSQRGDLYELVPSGKALNAGFAINRFRIGCIGYALATFPSSQKGEPLLAEMKRILENIRAKGVPRDLVEASKKRKRAEAEFRKNSVSGLAFAWVDAVADKGRNSPDEEIAAISRVTAEEVNQVAKKFLDEEQAVTAILTPETSGTPTHSSQGFGNSESFTPKKTIETALPDWAGNNLGRLTLPDSSVRPFVSQLPNGITLIVQPTDISNTVSVYGRIKNNPYLQTPSGKEGTDLVLNQLFSYGTQKKNRLAFQKALDDIAANEEAGTSFSLNVLSEDFERGIELLAENELSPAFPEKDFEIVREQTAASLEGKLKSPEYLRVKALNSALVPRSDPVLREATPESVRSLSYQDILGYYRQVFRPDMTTLVVIGKIKPEKAKKIILKYFSGWKAQGPKPETDLPPIPGNKPSSVNVPDASRSQDKVTLCSVLSLTRSNPDYYALLLGDHVLGGAFYATRFYRYLRGELGLVYFVSSNFDIRKTRAFYRADFACSPENVGKVHAIISRELKRLKTEPISESELLQAKSLLLREIPLSESSLDEIADGLLDRALHELPLDEPIVTAKAVLSLKSKDVMNAFAKWLDPDSLVEVSLGPKPK